MSTNATPKRPPGQPRRVGSYHTAIEWIAGNDDTEWLDDIHGSASVTLCLVADIFGREIEQATKDLRITFLRVESINFTRVS